MVFVQMQSIDEITSQYFTLSCEFRLNILFNFLIFKSNDSIVTYLLKHFKETIKNINFFYYY